MQVLVRDNNVDQALRVLKKKMQREGIFREMKARKAYEKPSERKTREKAEAVRRNRKAGAFCSPQAEAPPRRRRRRPPADGGSQRCAPHRGCRVKPSLKALLQAFRRRMMDHAPLLFY